MKKFLVFALIISVGFNLYLMDSTVEVVDDFDSGPAARLPKKPLIQDKIKLAQSSIKKTKDLETSKCKCSEVTNGLTTKSDSTPTHKIYDEKAVAKRIEKITTDWIKYSDDFFYNELRLRDDQIERYKELVLMRKQESDDYFSPKVKKAEHNAKLNNEKNSYYIHTTEDTVFMGKLAERYDLLLKENFGDQAFSDYKKFLKDYNKEIAEEDFFFPIDF